MPYAIPTFDALRTAYLLDVQGIDTTAAIDGDSDNFVRGSATASGVEGLYHHQLWIARQILPNDADPENIEAHAALRGLSLKPATTATGTFVLSGTPGSAALPGIVGVHEDTGEEFPSTGGGIIGLDGILTVPATAMRPGDMPDYDAVPVTLQNAPGGIDGTALLTLSGGTDAETHDQLLARLLEYMQNPPGGGRKEDYVRWAKEVPGVTEAWCYPARRGPGMVDVVIASAEGLPPAELVAAVQGHLDMERPVTCPDCACLAPVPEYLHIAARLRVAGTTLAALETPVRSALTAYFNAMRPGSTVIHKRLESILMGLQGVEDATVDAPEANVRPGDISWPRLGTITLGPL